MRVRLYLQETVEEYAEDHANGKKHFSNWLTAIRKADWEEPGDITKTINGNLLGNGSNRVVFDVGGDGRNAFRIICEYLFNCPYKKEGVSKVHLYVNWIGTHEEYNSLSEKDKLEKEMF